MTDEERPASEGYIQRTEAKQKAAQSRIEGLAARKREATRPKEAAGTVPAKGAAWTSGLTPEAEKALAESRKLKIKHPLLHERKRPNWLIRDLLVLNSTAVLSGPAGTGKSFLVLSWLFHIANGMSWNGKKVRQGACVYVCGEGLEGIWNRLDALSLDEARPIEITTPIGVSNREANLSEQGGVDEVLAEVQAFTEEYGQLSLIVIDTLARNFGAGDENSSMDMGQFIKGCERIRATTGACVLLVHHTGHGDKSRARGSSALTGAVHTDLILSRVEGNRICLESNKVKDGKPLKPMNFHLNEVELDYVDDEGEPVTSCVMRYMPDVEAIVRAVAKRGGPNQKKAMDILRKQYALQRANVEASGRPASAAHVTIEKWKELCSAAGLDRFQIRDVLKSLSNSGKVRIDGLHVYLGDESSLDEVA